MSQVVIGISGNIKEMPVLSGMNYDAAPRALSESVLAAGGLPILIPTGVPSQAKAYIDLVDKLLLSGGQHVDPRFYGETRLVESDDYNLARDEFELALIAEALKQNKPIFAVCRGMQLLNVALGGTLHQAVEDHWQADNQKISHPVEVAEGSRMAQLFQEARQINSFHHQSVKALAPELVVTARDPRDGTIEAYEGKERPLMGIQWHPEFLVADCEANRALFDFLVQEL